MRITSTAQARKVLEVDMIVYTKSGDYVKVIGLTDTKVDCIDAIINEDGNVHTVGGAYYRTYTDFIGEEI